jgi:hypothetical protein
VIRRSGPRDRTAAARVAPLLLLGVSLAGAAFAGALIELQRDGQAFVAPGAGEVQPVRPALDSSGAVVWPGPMRPWGGGDCPTGQVRIWQVEPRIEEHRCPTPKAGDAQGRAMAFDRHGAMLWSTALDPDGPDARVAGINADGLLLNTLWRLDFDGRSTDLVAAHPGRRALRLPAPIAVDEGFVYAAESPGGLFARGSLIRLDRSTGTRESLVALPRRGLISRWQVKDLALSADRRWLFAALAEDWRGPTRVALAVLDLEARRWRAVVEHCADGYCVQPRVLAEGERLGFAYHDLHQARLVFLRYRWQDLQ